MTEDTETMKKRRRSRSDVATFVRELESALDTRFMSKESRMRRHAQGSHFGHSSHSSSSDNSSTNPTWPSTQHDSSLITNSHNTMNVAWETQEGPASTDASPFMGLPPMQLIVDGLESVDSATLRQSLDPIWKSLESLDAIAMLDLKRVKHGARVSDGVQVKPIHEEVTPVRYRRGSCVRYIHVSEVPDKYSVGIFIFPPHARIPLHDHPGMCVLSRILYGDIDRLSLDLPRENVEQYPMMDEPTLDAQPHHPSSPSSSWFPRWKSALPSNKNRLPAGSRRAYMNGLDHLQAPDVTVLYPYEGNLHEFIAGPDGAAVLDILLPPYDEGHHRECTFYNIREDNGSPASEHQPCWIIPTNQPEDFHCLSGRYRDLGGDDFDEEDD